MPCYALIAYDTPDSLPARLAARPAHLARLEALQAEGRLVLAGPCPVDEHDPAQGMVGSLVVVDFPDRASLNAWLAEEPYVHAGVYQRVEVRLFRQVFPA